MPVMPNFNWTVIGRRWELRVHTMGGSSLRNPYGLLEPSLVGLRDSRAHLKKGVFF